MAHSTYDLKSISTIFSNFVIPISLIVGGIWTLNIFSKRKEEAALLVKIEKIELHYSKDKSKSYLQIGVMINNIGKRDLDLLYQTATIRVSKVNTDKDGSLNLKNKQTGLVSHDLHITGRIRPNDQQKVPYFIEIEEPGLYFVEFVIDVDMKKYYKGIFKIDKDKEIKTWSDGTFFMADK